MNIYLNLKWHKFSARFVHLDRQCLQAYYDDIKFLIGDLLNQVIHIQVTGNIPSKSEQINICGRDAPSCKL